MEVLLPAISDRFDAVTGQDSYLAASTIRRLESIAQESETESVDLLNSLLATRTEIKPKIDLGSLRGLVADLRALATNLQWKAERGDARATAELALVQKEVDVANIILSEQLKVIRALEKFVSLIVIH